MSFKPCLVIPSFNHHAAIEAVLERLADYNLPCFLVDDGSNDESRQALARAAAGREWVTLLRHSANLGKGAAVVSGLRAAQAAGCSHALQVDADGQHDLGDLPKMLEAARAQPDSLVSGWPQYDSSVPKGRLIGRYLTHFWVWVETLSFAIRDSMCGYRVYPLAATLALLDRVEPGRRMDFDTEIMVRLYWQGLDMVMIPTRVTYPEQNTSNFRMVRDNLRISSMHTRLVLGMLRRLPRLLARNSRHREQAHWARVEERGSTRGVRTLFLINKWFGRPGFAAILYPVMTYFYLTGHGARRASADYLRRIFETSPEPGFFRSRPGRWQSFRHFMTFGHALMDKAQGWTGRLQSEQVEVVNPEVLAEATAPGRGAIFLSAHHGNLDMCRSLGNKAFDNKINVLMLTELGSGYNAVLREANPEFEKRVIQVSSIGPDTAIMLQEKIDRGEYLFILADRTSATVPGRSRQLDFLGSPAAFGEGSFILASLLKCPVYLMYCLQVGKGYQMHVERFREQVILPRRQRSEGLQAVMADYVARLEHYCYLAPLQWFNFYDFWRTPSGQTKSFRNVAEIKGEKHIENV